jgi:hypothetical protein
MAKQLYYYDKQSNIVALGTLAEQPANPTLAIIQSWLQNPMGVSGPTCILTLDSAGKLDQLNVGNLTATNITGTTIIGSLDGGDF